MTSRINTRRRRTATIATGTAGAALAITCVLALAGCTASNSTASPQESASATPAVPLPSPSGTWTPGPTTPAEGPKTPAPQPTQSAAIGEPVSFGTQVDVKLVGVAATSVTAETPGENTGPAVKVTVSVTNNSTEPVDVSSAVVSLEAAKHVLGVPTTAGSPDPLSGTVKPGASTQGTYVFMLDPAKGRAVTISVNYAAGEPVAVFTGKTS